MCEKISDEPIEFGYRLAAFIMSILVTWTCRDLCCWTFAPLVYSILTFTFYIIRCLRLTWKQ